MDKINAEKLDNPLVYLPLQKFEKMNNPFIYCIFAQNSGF